MKSEDEIRNTVETYSDMLRRVCFVYPVSYTHLYVYYEKEYCVIGQHTKKRITLGDKVMIRVVSADVAASKIEFTFA